MCALTDYEPAQLADQFRQWGHKPTQAARLLKHFYEHDGRMEWGDVQIGKALQEQLRATITLRQSEVLARTQSTDGTVKLLIGFAGGGSAEAVLMPAYREDRAAGCVSSQIGCPMGCDFCASTRTGLERNLTAGEIVEQFLHLRQESRQGGRRLATLVFMGMGEPMLNLENVIPAIGRIARPGMGELGGRQITVSTVGIVPGIDALAGANLNVHLALSLHAPDDTTRAKLVPANRRYGVADVIAAGRRFEAETGRVVTIEYCLLRGINDSPEQAIALASVLNGFRAHVNLIAYNGIGQGLSGVVYERPPQERMNQFLATLREHGVIAHFRRSRGDDVDAGCGQLRDRRLTPAPLGGPSVEQTPAS